MADQMLTPEEIAQLQAAGDEIQRKLKSLREDLAAGLPVQPQIDALESAEVTRKHMLKKYGAVASPIRPRRK